MNRFKCTLYASIIIVIFILCCEVFLSFIDIDLKLLKKVLFYQADDLEVYKVSENAERLFELRPGSSAQYNYLIHPKEIKYTTRTVTINSLGFRDQERQKIKDKNVFRIIILGGSNTYGAAVSNEDTYPAQMQRIFDITYPGKIEVWNAGVCAYVLSQKIAYAEYIIETFDPDLLIFQHNNLGRRAFLLNMNMKSLKASFRKNRELYAENIPLLFLNKSIKTHNFLVSYSRIYRIFFISLNVMFHIYERMYPSWSPFADIHSAQKFDEFLKKYKDKKIIVFDPIENGKRCDTLKRKIKEDVTCFFLNTENKDEEYSYVHPPSYVYEWYAQELCAFLMENNYLSNMN